MENEPIQASQQDRINKIRAEWDSPIQVSKMFMNQEMFDEIKQFAGEMLDESTSK